MKILVTGASGMVGAQIVMHLLQQEHEIICCVRNVEYTKNLFPQATVIACDFLRDTHGKNWIPRLQGVDVVINAVGIFYHRHPQIIWALHYETPRTLFEACVAAGVKRIIQISALGIEKSNVAYAQSKLAADKFLLTLPIKAIILRPSLIYGPAAFGGMALFRGLASLPYVLPVVGNGAQQFQPIFIEDLSRAILNAIEMPLKKSLILNAVSPEPITLKQMLLTLREWLGFRKTLVIKVPLFLIRAGATMGSIFSSSLLNKDAYQMLMQSNITTAEEGEKFQQQVNVLPRTFAQGLQTIPSTPQDRAQAKIFFLIPFLKLSIAFIWVMSALCSAFFYPKAESYLMLSYANLPNSMLPFTLYTASIWNLLLGIGMYTKFVNKIYLLQIITILTYTIIITFIMPALWLHPFGPIVKNIPIMAAILLLWRLETDK